MWQQHTSLLSLPTDVLLTIVSGFALQETRYWQTLTDRFDLLDNRHLQSGLWALSLTCTRLHRLAQPLLYKHIVPVAGIGRVNEANDPDAIASNLAQLSSHFWHTELKCKNVKPANNKKPITTVKSFLEADVSARLLASRRFFYTKSLYLHVQTRYDLVYGRMEATMDESTAIPVLRGLIARMPNLEEVHLHLLGTTKVNTICRLAEMLATFPNLVALGLTMHIPYHVSTRTRRRLGCAILSRLMHPLLPKLSRFSLRAQGIRWNAPEHTPTIVAPNLHSFAINLLSDIHNNNVYPEGLRRVLTRLQAPQLRFFSFDADTVDGWGPSVRLDSVTHFFRRDSSRLTEPVHKYFPNLTTTVLDFRRPCSMLAIPRGLFESFRDALTESIVVLDRVGWGVHAFLTMRNTLQAVSGLQALVRSIEFLFDPLDAAALPPNGIGCLHLHHTLHFLSQDVRGSFFSIQHAFAENSGTHVVLPAEVIARICNPPHQGHRVYHEHASTSASALLIA